MTARTNGEDCWPDASGDAYDLRLLPWNSPDDKPCLLSSDGSRGVMTRYADSVEAAQMVIGAETLADLGKLLADPAACCRHLRPLLQRAADSLSDVMRVAESRGDRLPALDDDLEEPEAEDPASGRALDPELTALPHPEE